MLLLLLPRREMSKLRLLLLPTLLLESAVAALSFGQMQKLKVEL